MDYFTLPVSSLVSVDQVVAAKCPNIGAIVSKYVYAHRFF